MLARLQEATLELRKTKIRRKYTTRAFQKMLQEWIKIHIIPINVLNIVYDKIDIGPHKGSPRLNVIIDRESDYQKMFRKPCCTY